MEAPNTADNGLTVGQLARKVGLGVETIRFYERRGLIEDPPRRPSGYRQYPPEAVDRLRFVRNAKTLGFTLDEIRELLELRSQPSENREQVRARSRVKIEDIDQRIAALVRMKHALSTLVDACEHHLDLPGCPILSALEPESETGER